MSDEPMRIQVKRGVKGKKPAYEIEKRDDGHFYITSVAAKKSSIKPGDRLIEINGVKESDFKDVEKVQGLFDMLIMDIIPNDESEEEEDEEKPDSGSEEGEKGEAEDLD